MFNKSILFVTLHYTHYPGTTEPLKRFVLPRKVIALMVSNTTVNFPLPSNSVLKYFRLFLITDWHPRRPRNGWQHKT